PLKAALRYVFPDHWSFLLGELALYAFTILVLTGVFLAVTFQPGDAQVVWHGPYAPLDGTTVSTSYASALDLSFKVPGGLLIRQTHHWAALMFVVAITLHLLRIVYSGAFRKPREINHLVGVTLLTIALIEGFAGYSLLDDLLSGMGIAIGYSAALAIPGIGGAVGALVWDGPFPGGDVFLPRLFAAHVFVIPAVLALLIAAHLAMIIRRHHTQWPGPGRREDNVVGSPTWPGYALRSLGWFAATAAVLLLLGGLVQINPVWQWGPYEPWVGGNGAQPDWYLGWLIGALRLMPGFDIHAFGRTLIPNPFFGGLLFPGIVFTVLAGFPWIDRALFTRDRREHHLLERPRDRPRRTAFITAFLVWVVTVFAFGSADRIFLTLSISYVVQLWIFRVLFFVAPVLAYVITRRWCETLRRSGEHPLREPRAVVVRSAAAPDAAGELAQAERPGPTGG
ncbi:MAG: ubiquinol-cytochrome c reductase cytochrome b subunit, partial [Solirubrobacteraceae bacterium]|nr:ubiquinol-cytochrome c reductase cytochrome b subunit [Solirubrobacteraceae bacterium]